MKSFEVDDKFFDIQKEKEIIFISSIPNTNDYIICHDGKRSNIYSIKDILNPKEYRNYKIYQILNSK